MARKKVALKYITNDAKRKTSLKKRKCGMIKKVSEITTLCGVEACAIIKAPDESEVEVWPSPMGAGRVISKFLQMPEVEQNKNMLTQETYLAQNIQMIQEQVKKLRTENRKKEMNNVMYHCLNDGGEAILEQASLVDLNDLAWVIDQNLKDINARISMLEVQEGTSNEEAIINGGDEVQQLVGDFADNLQNDSEPFPFSP